MTMDDEKFGRFLEQEARAYNAPPPDVPRDEMWLAIHARRRTAASRRGRSGLWIGLAATLLVGVALGRYSTRPRGAGEGTGSDPAALAAAASAGPGVAYQLAARENLVRAEALLTAYRASDPGTSGVADASRITDWAKDVLQNTRLLLDSPAAADPQRARLLRDLEAVLVQMIQRSPSGLGVDESRAQVNRSIERTQMLTRLRSERPLGFNGENGGEER
ncbi:MAG: hypothetical protein ACHQQ3_02650 [Gemmatimonadales bacterium]